MARVYPVNSNLAEPLELDLTTRRCMKSGPQMLNTQSNDLGSLALVFSAVSIKIVAA